MSIPYALTTVRCQNPRCKGLVHSPTGKPHIIGAFNLYSGTAILRCSKCDDDTQIVAVAGATTITYTPKGRPPG